MNISQPVNSKINGVSFTFYDASEVRRISVKQVVNPILLDVLGNPTKGGLYDPAMGPFSKHHLCATCSLDYFNCPGHFGHIELPSPVVNPMMFDQMFRLLQGCCFYCHRFRFSRVEAARYIAKLKLIEYGLVQEANDLDDLLPHTGENFFNGSDNEDDDDDDDEDIVTEVTEPDVAKGGRSKNQKQSSGETPAEYIKRINDYVEDKLEHCQRSSYKVTMVNDIRSKLIRELVERSKRPTCMNCRGPQPRLRRDGYLKVFREALSKKALANKQSKNLEFRDVLNLSMEDLINGAVSKKMNETESSAMDVDESESESEGESTDVESEDEAGTNKYDSIDAVPNKKGIKNRTVFLTPIHLRNHLRLLFTNEAEIVQLLFQQRDPRITNALTALDKSGKSITLTLPKDVRSPAQLANMMFIEALPVPPTRFRPAAIMGDQVMENPHNIYLGNVLRSCVFLRNIVNPGAADDGSRKPAAKSAEAESQKIAAAAAAASISKGGDIFERVINGWIQLQQAVNNVMDSTKNPSIGNNGKAPDPGIRQLLEKKEGLFRQNMMGKRVNYAARSVISPDPNLESDEVGVPPVFAQRLTFPEPVTAHNVKELSQLVINGPDKWPGAVSVQYEDGSMVHLDRLSHESRVALANQLLTPQESARSKGGAGIGNLFMARTAGVNKKVYRHLRNGDMVVMNRQPTLHRASMAGMRARVLPGERTLRFHYMNCNQFNSDFDGDEMNMHFPQSEAARSELRNIMGADHTYINPTDGDPLRGLIQDSVDGGVLLTKRDTFLTKSEYQELVYWALRPENQPQLPDGKVQLLPPAIFKPKPMWTGKQVISTLLLNLTYGYAPLNIVSKDKIGSRYWGSTAREEERVLVLDSELLVGVLDKSQFGASKFGLVHTVYELYTPKHAGQFLSTLGRLFLRYIQEIGFSCRMEDLLFVKEGNSTRKEILKDQATDSTNATLEFIGMKDYTADQMTTDKFAKHEFENRMKDVFLHDQKLAMLDNNIKGKMDDLTSRLIGSCLPKHLQLPFPHNNMVVMTTSGAKGSNVNLSQITCCLGQQTLEGRRVPLMVSGKSLPSFVPFDSTGRAGGYVADRFLTGLRPQEFYFHCMAGREGLIDTAVKTSRSGYLQRCIIKHLEGVKVHYDYTVRDSDGSVLQFQYGEDSLDILKCQHLDQFDFSAANYRALRDKFNPSSAASALEEELARKYNKKILKDFDSYNPMSTPSTPVITKYNPCRHLGSVSESFYVDLEKYLSSNPSNLIHKKKSKKEKKGDKAEKTSDKAVVKASKSLSDKIYDSVCGSSALSAAVSSECTVRNFRMLKYLHYLSSLIEPGECVGLLAAEGVGEPSTQMTLNTFHLAGVSSKNVTMGIPRLREIVMVASDHISAPTMDIPLVDGVTKEHAGVIAGALTRLSLSDIVDYVQVDESLTSKKDSFDNRRYRRYKLRLQMFPSDEFESEHDVSREDIEYAIEHYFTKNLEAKIAKDLKRTYRISVSNENIGEDEDIDDASDSESKTKDVASEHYDESDIESDDEDAENADGDADDARAASRRAEKSSYDGPDDEDQEIINALDQELNDLDSRSKKSAKPSNDNNDDDAKDVEMDDGKHSSVTSEQASAHATARRSKRMTKNYAHVVSYNYVDSGEETYAEILMQFPATTPKFLMLSLAEQAVKDSIVREIPGISACYINEPDSEMDTSLVIGANGSNIRGIWDASLIPLDDIADADEPTGLDSWIDINHLYTNDIAAILKVYGVEAARAAIVREIIAVFDPYHIDIDRRHLSLIADYMTFEGGFKPFNRIGLSSSTSPLAKMSFESTCTFIQRATAEGDFDELHNPSARIVLGQPVTAGTGSFDVLTDLTARA